MNIILINKKINFLNYFREIQLRACAGRHALSRWLVLPGKPVAYSGIMINSAIGTKLIHFFFLNFIFIFTFIFIFISQILSR